MSVKGPRPTRRLGPYELRPRKWEGPGHWPKPNRARTRCTICGNPVIKSGNGWIHGKWAKPRARNPESIPAQLAWHEAMDDYRAAIEARDNAFRAMAKAGMLANHIAEATGLTQQGCFWIAEQLGVTLARINGTRPRTILGRRAPDNPDAWSLWGDDDILQRPAYKNAEKD